MRYTQTHTNRHTKWFNKCLMVCMLACLDRMYDIYRMLISSSPCTRYTHTYSHTPNGSTNAWPQWLGKTLGVKHLSNHLVCMLVSIECMRVCACVYVYGSNMIMSMYMLHIYIYIYMVLIWSFPGTWRMSIYVVVHRDTSIHTKWFDKGLTPRLGKTFGVKHCRTTRCVCCCA